MNWTAKTRPGAAATAAGAAPAKPGPSVSSSTSANVRISNGLKEFLWQLQGIGRGTLLDVGPVWQSTVRFFVERGYKLYTEDVLIAWRDFLAAEEAARRARPSGSAVPNTAAFRRHRPAP